MSLVTVAQVRALINSSLTDAQIQEVIDRVEDEITARIGAPQDDGDTVTIVKVLSGEGENLFLPSEISSVVSIVEDDVSLDESEYRVWSGAVLERRPAGSHWGERCTVTYKPVDDRKRRAGVIIDLVRVELNRTAMRSENVAGEYSYTAPDNWEAERKRIIRRIAFPVVG
jgi:hypothetical protein